MQGHRGAVRRRGQQRYHSHHCPRKKTCLRKDTSERPVASCEGRGHRTSPAKPCPEPAWRGGYPRAAVSPCRKPTGGPRAGKCRNGHKIVFFRNAALGVCPPPPQLEEPGRSGADPEPRPGLHHDPRRCCRWASAQQTPGDAARPAGTSQRRRGKEGAAPEAFSRNLPAAGQGLLTVAGILFRTHP